MIHEDTSFYDNKQEIQQVSHSIPNIQEKIQKMIAKYRAETLDIEDVEYEEADLDEDVLFAEDDDKKH